MSGRFYPTGYIGSENALLVIARIRDPERWDAKALPDEERSVWDNLGVNLNAEYTADHLRVLIKKRDEQAEELKFHRLADFSAALGELRKSLHDGTVVAYTCNDSGMIKPILKDGWGMAEGADILLRGVVDLADGSRRGILFKPQAIEKFARALPPAWGDEKKLDRSRAVKRSAREKREIYSKFRQSLGDSIPTRREDIKAMKALGISREDTRNLRKDHPSRPRGRPKAPRN
jgi:hypothetical protein